MPLKHLDIPIRLDLFQLFELLYKGLSPYLGHFGAVLLRRLSQCPAIFGQILVVETASLGAYSGTDGSLAFLVVRYVLLKQLQHYIVIISRKDDFFTFLRLHC